MSWPARVVSTELRKIIAYRSDFWVNFLGQSLLQLFIARALWQSLFSLNNTNVMGGFTLDEITLYYLLAPLTVKILMGENIGFLARDIYEGGLNRYLVWPLPALGYKMLTYLTHSLFFLVQLGLIYTVARFLISDAPYSLEEAVRLLAGMGYLAIATLAYFCMMGLCEMVAFWIDNTWTLGVMLRFSMGFLGGIALPLSFFPESLREFLGYLPFAAMASGPINLILGRSTPMEALNSFVVLLCWLPPLALCVRWMWKRGNLQYTGVGL